MNRLHSPTRPRSYLGRTILGQGFEFPTPLRNRSQSTPSAARDTACHQPVVDGDDQQDGESIVTSVTD